eukprot:2769686-Amphidinium_carterae.1
MQYAPSIELSKLVTLSYNKLPGSPSDRYTICRRFTKRVVHTCVDALLEVASALHGSGRKAWECAATGPGIAGRLHSSTFKPRLGIKQVG